MKRFLSVIWVMFVASWVVREQSGLAQERDPQGNRPAAAAVAGYRGGESTGVIKWDVTQWRPLGPFGGDVEDINVSPTSPNVMLAGVAPSGSVGGKLFRSTDSGASWTEVPSFGQRSAYDIEFTASGTAWVASDDSVWVSTDNGATFTQRSLGIGLNDQTYAVEIDPSNPQVLWVAVADALGNQTTNVLKSINGGSTWTNVTPPGAGGVSCTDIAINPTNSAQVMVTFGGAFGGGSVYFTPDGGQSWNNVSGGLPTTPARVVRCDHGRWFVGGGQLFGSQYFGVWQSTNNGQAWTELDNGWPHSIATGIAIDPNNPNVILAATVDGVHKSINAGQTWTVSSGKSGAYSMSNVRFAPGSSTRAAMGAASFGVILTDDTANTTRISSVGIGSLNLFSVAANPTNTDELAVAFQGQNNGGVYASTNAGLTWVVQQVPGTRYNYVKFDLNGVLYALSDGPSSIAPEGVYRRNANGTWTSLGPDQGPLFETELWSIDFGQSNRNLFITGGNDFGVAGFEGTVWRSPDSGGTWTKTLETTAGQDGTAQRVMIIPDGTDQIVLAGMQTFSSTPVNGVYRSIDSGVTWTQILGTGLPSTLWGYDLTTSPVDPHTVYVTDGNFSGGGIYRSTDAGATWSTYLTGYNVRGVAVDPSSPDDVYFWTVFASAPVYHASHNGTVVIAASTGLGGGPHQIVAVPGRNPRLLLATTVGAYELQLPVQRPDLRIGSAGNSVVLSWTNAAFGLQAGPTVTGPFTNVPGATSPYTTPTAGAARFFRLSN